MNRCIACHRVSYKPEMPEQIYGWPSAHAANIRSFFPPLEVGEDGLCEQCRVSPPDA